MVFISAMEAGEGGYDDWRMFRRRCGGRTAWGEACLDWKDSPKKILECRKCLGQINCEGVAGESPSMGYL